jgi:hypothetical protein
VRKHRRKLIVLAVLAVLVGVTVLRGHWDEPHYKARSLSYWVGLYTTAGTNSAAAQRHQAAANEAVRHIGTNALPYLLSWLDYDPYPRAMRIAKMRSHLPTSLTHSRFATWLYRDPSQRRSTGATYALLALGPQAQPALPDLVRMLNTTNSEATPARAMLVLVGLGDDAIPPLTAATRPGDPMRETLFGIVTNLADISNMCAMLTNIAGPNYPTMTSNALAKVVAAHNNSPAN